MRDVTAPAITIIKEGDKHRPSRNDECMKWISVTHVVKVKIVLKQLHPLPSFEVERF
jgi:hypothetical protein